MKFHILLVTYIRQLDGHSWAHRLDLLEFFKRECEERGACIVYTTHIFDGLAPWITHIAYMEDGKLLKGSIVSACLSGSTIGFVLTIVRLCTQLQWGTGNQW